MSVRRKKGKKSNNAEHDQQQAVADEEDMKPTSISGNSMAVSSSLNSIQINPRTPKTPRTPRMGIDDAEEGVELSLLGEEERERASRGLRDDEDSEIEEVNPLKRPIGAKDKRNMVLLCILYLIQGVPLGLALGSVPFILREHLSYSQLATFSLASYPYSLKLLWSPIVDSVYFTRIGRRKSWILPMQFIVGSLMLYISLNVQKLLDDPANNIIELSVVFTSLVFFSATQDIAVDGWALTLLSQDCLSYASTCQTIGLNTGFFASFTVFLAFNSEAFATKWGVPHLTLAAYLKFWSVVCYTVTLWLLFFKKEDKEPANEAEMSIKSVYKTIWTICKLRHVQILVLVHLVAKIGFAANEAVTSLKMVEKGFKREDLALVVLIDFPFQIMGGWLAAKWSRGDKPLRPWLIAFAPRLLLALIATLIVLWFPKAPISTGFFLFLIIHTVISSFASTVQFVGISAFHTRVSDPLIGGTYMTLLNTFTNMGGTWPKWFVLKGVDLLTDATCQVAEGITLQTTECVSDHGKATCKDLNGECITRRDGYYAMSALCMVVGVVLLVTFIIPRARKLQALPISVWRVKME
ncbi:acetyl-coenzyme A transporter 1-domain-containing protein [Lyophyllum atratum]|nr:acetyl-coenzyme A transporter 1-domain-containing protein [Lyophyllum atratum]